MRITSRAEIWEKAYEAFQEVNFAAWDYNTIKQSLIDYVKLYRTEDFSDFIESSEFITILEIFAYVGELLAYRVDMNAHENFISTASRKESVLRLAKLLSYNASRNIPARGLVKVMTCSTSERTYDSRGVDLTNKLIYWNDPNNVNWKEQFILVMNRALEQEFGSVLASDRVQIDDVLFELYTLKNTELATETIRFFVNISSESIPMEIVAAKLDSASGPYEKRPEQNQKMTILYSSDGLGDASQNTGFFYLAKQGTLGKVTTTLDGVTPNQFIDVNVMNCNETDVWVNNIDPETNDLIVGNTITGTRDGEWERVDIANAQNVLFNTSPYTNKFELETLDNDKFRVIFGDGNFARIPSGKFDIWYRVSANKDLVIPTTAIQSVSIPVPYLNANGKSELLTTAVSLTLPIQNATPSEDIDQIRRIAPAVYYTQDRMVNNKDYNEFMLQNNTILKLRAINRTFAGDSKYIKWHDPREYYENVKIFGDDLAVYYNTYEYVVTAAAGDVPNSDGGANVALIDTIVDNYMQEILQTQDYFVTTVLAGITPLNVRKSFNSSERLQIESALLNIINSAPDTFYLVLNIADNAWVIESSEPPEWDMSISITVDGNWVFVYNATKIVVNSYETRFWLSNNDQNTVTYDTLNPNFDNIVILKANTTPTGEVLTSNMMFRILKQVRITQGTETGTDSIHALEVIPEDTNNDGIPDDVTLSYLIDPNVNFVYFYREGTGSPWVLIPYSDATVASYEADVLGLWKREAGREDLNFAWFHRTPRYHLVDPAPSNIIDTFIIQRGYYLVNRLWLSDRLTSEPLPPTSYQLKSDYSNLLQSKMISDTIILHPGKIKIILGKKASPELRATLKIIRPSFKTLTNNQVKAKVVDLVNEFFEIDKWEFGETFYFSELASYIHSKLSTEIDTIVLVPTGANQVYGDLQQIFAKEDEILQPNISVNDIEIVESLNPRILKQTL
jgi:hypothetical protein